MRIPAPVLHYGLASAPLALMLAGLYLAWGSEAQVIWAFRLHKYEHETFRQCMFWVTDWGNLAVYGVYAALLARGLAAGDRGPLRRVLCFAAAQALFGLLILNGLKMTLGRPRPMYASEPWTMFTTNARFHSLPSGHTAEITGSGLPLALWLGRPALSLLLGCGVALMGLTRIYLNEHYPSDVAAGWGLGLGAAWLTQRLWRRHAA